MTATLCPVGRCLGPRPAVRPAASARHAEPSRSAPASRRPAGCTHIAHCSAGRRYARPVWPGEMSARRIAEITTAKHLDRLIKEWRDRFGAFPEAVENLITLARIKLAAAKQEITRVETREHKLMLTRRGDFILVAGKFPALVAPEIEKRLQEILGLLGKL